MARGRRPKHSSQKVGQSKRKGKLNPDADGTRPVMPIDMPPIGAAFWDKHAETLIADGRLTQREDDAFSLLCYIMSDISMLRKEIERDGFTVEGARGNPVRNPCIQIQKDKEQQAVKLMLEFGLTPASRGRVPIGDPEEGYEDLD